MISYCKQQETNRKINSNSKMKWRSVLSSIFNLTILSYTDNKIYIPQKVEMKKNITKEIELIFLV